MAPLAERLLVKREGELSPEERQLVTAWGSECFGPQEWLRAFAWSTPNWRLFLLDNGVPVSHVKITVRQARVGGNQVLLAGVGGVMTPRINQRKGYSSALLELTEEFVFSEIRADHGFLFCLPELTSFYARLGWLQVHSAVHIEHPDGTMVWPKAAMVLPGPNTAWHDADVDVRGNPW